MIGIKISPKNRKFVQMMRVVGKLANSHRKKLVCRRAVKCLRCSHVPYKNVVAAEANALLVQQFFRVQGISVSKVHVQTSKCVSHLFFRVISMIKKTFCCIVFILYVFFSSLWQQEHIYCADRPPASLKRTTELDSTVVAMKLQ